MSTLDKELYEEFGAVAGALHPLWRDHFAHLVRELLVHNPNARDAGKRWLRDAGYEPVRNYQVGS